jgi:ribosomal protein L18
LAVLFVAIVFVQSGKALVLIKLAIGEDEDEDSTPGILSALKGLSNRVNRWAGAMIQEKTKDRLQFAVATPTVKRQTEYRQPTTPEPQTTRRQPTKTETQTKKRVDISVGSLSEPGKLSVTFEGKSYTLQQMTDKMRKWYARAKTAKSEKSRASNWHKYETAKAQLSGHLVFRERHKSVTIEKK